jgi:hypothetical protein
MQSDLKWQRPFFSGTSTNRRDDADITLSGGRRWRGDYREIAVWYTRSRWGYPGGSEDGSRAGGRILWEPRLSEVNQLLLTADIDRAGARFQPLASGVAPGGQRFVSGFTVSDRYSRGLLHLKGSVRGEIARYTDRNTDDNPFSYTRGGGHVSALFGDTLGFGVELGATKSWRWASLDETYGFWSRDEPNRFMDLRDIEEGINKVYGDPSLGPIETTWSGGGLRWIFNDNRLLRFRVGRRQWSSTHDVQEAFYSVYVRRELPGFDAIEASGEMDLRIAGPFSASGAWTYMNAGDREFPMPEQWGWLSLRSDHRYYNGQLLIRGDVTLRHFGEYSSSEYHQPARNLVDLSVRVILLGFELYYSRTNVTQEMYEYAPGYTGMHLGEVWGIRWVLLN